MFRLSFLTRTKINHSLPSNRKTCVCPFYKFGGKCVKGTQCDVLTSSWVKRLLQVLVKLQHSLKLAFSKHDIKKSNVFSVKDCSVNERDAHDDAIGWQHSVIDSRRTDYEEENSVTDSIRRLGNEKNDALGFRGILSKNAITKILLVWLIPKLRDLEKRKVLMISLSFSNTLLDYRKLSQAPPHQQKMISCEREYFQTESIFNDPAASIELPYFLCYFRYS